jgi:hypothetical protein
MPSRRHVLSLLSAAPFAPALAGCASSDLPDPVAGWRDPGAGETDPRRFALAHAILAPNPHNTQSWLIELDDADGMTLYCDLDRRLDFTDPLDRQITIGCGCFLELFRMSAGLQGYWPVIEMFPDGEPAPRLDSRPVARVRMVPSALLSVAQGGIGLELQNPPEEYFVFVGKVAHVGEEPPKKTGKV